MGLSPCGGLSHGLFDQGQERASSLDGLGITEPGGSLPPENANLSLFSKHFLFLVRSNFYPLPLVFVMFVVVCIHVSV